MFESFGILTCILFFIILTYAYQMRQRKYNKYPTSCDVLYYPKNEKIKIIDPKSYKNADKMKYSKKSEYPD